MNMTAGRKPRLVDDDDYDIESSRIEKISSEDLRKLLDDDGPTDEVEQVMPNGSDE